MKSACLHDNSQLMHYDERGVANEVNMCGRFNCFTQTQPSLFLRAWANRRCPTGEARITPGFRLEAKFVVSSDAVATKRLHRGISSGSVSCAFGPRFHRPLITYPPIVHAVHVLSVASRSTRLVPSTKTKKLQHPSCETPSR